MSTNAHIRRVAAAAGASGLIALSLAGSAAARVDPGTGGLHEQPSTAIVTGPQVSVPITRVLKVDDDALELIQVGAGLVAGLVLGGAGIVLVTRRTYSHATAA